MGIDHFFHANHSILFTDIFYRFISWNVLKKNLGTTQTFVVLWQQFIHSLIILYLHICMTYRSGFLCIKGAQVCYLVHFTSQTTVPTVVLDKYTFVNLWYCKVASLKHDSVVTSVTFCYFIKVSVWGLMYSTLWV